MLQEFFQIGPLPAHVMQGTYDIRLVILSYLVATFASYIALDITGRLRDFSNTQLSSLLWIVGGAIAMGAGIWSMHFIGMLAFSLPMPMFYGPGLTITSMLVAIFASAFALTVLNAKVIHMENILLGGVILGLAIAAMHYTGMAAMTDVNIHYLPGLFFLSIVIAIFASEVALWLALKSTEVISSIRTRLKFVSAFIMGAAICGMHYTGMAAAVFTAKNQMIGMMGNALNPSLLAMSIAGVTFLILGIAFLVSWYKESISQQLLITARQAGMAEVASSVLHNVGNVLNSINVSSLLIAEKIKQSRLSTLEGVSQMVEQHKENFSQFVSSDPQGKHLPDYLQTLSKYWSAEQQELTSELQTLVKNVNHVRNIISSQQDLSRITDKEQLLSIENVVEEALLISGVENEKYNIKVEKNYKRMKPVLLDKVKLLQVLVNLIQNGKEALLLMQGKTNKTFQIKLDCDDEEISICFCDNGIGIDKENLVKIFMYGFTTKKTGHGFGLHTSAVLAKEMGGKLIVKSEGLNKGATFILTLPYRHP